jgi:DNA-binding SARP family transcriptional activator
MSSGQWAISEFMNKKYYNIFITFILFCIFFVLSPKIIAQTYGLKFQGQEVTLDKRTELNLTPNDFLKFQDEFEISFDYKIDLLEPNSIFGYVFRVINIENNNVDLLSTPSPDISLNLVVGKSNSIIPVNYPTNSINNWINLRVKFLLAEGKLILYTHDSLYVQEGIGFKKQDEFKIIFGGNDYNQFKTTDVPSINIKNIKLSEKGVLRYHWPLDEIDGNYAEDKIKSHKALVKNPVWLKLRHQSWQINYENEVNGPQMVAFDEKNERIFMVGADELLIYSGKSNNIQEVKYQNKPQFINRNYKAIYNGKNNMIYCYFVDSGSVYSFDIEKGIWNDIGVSSDFSSKFDNHNGFYNPNNNSIYVFGGYGFHKYNNEIRKIDLTNNSIEDLSTNDSIFRPRYLAGLGVLNDTVYIFGGYGSVTGNQLINPQSYYDLIGYSINSGSFFKKFDIHRFMDDMAVGNSMFIDYINHDYYALVFEKSKFDGYLQLIKGNIDSPEIEKAGDKIPYQFLDVRSYASLFYMPLQKKLFVYTSYLSESNKTKAAIYSISYPPDKFEEITLIKQKSRIMTYLYWVLVFMLLSGLIFLFYRKRKVYNKVQLPVDNDSNPVENQVYNTYNPAIEEVDYQIIFFGGFQVFNNDFVDITNKFSPLLRELFLLIMLNTFKNNKGVGSEKITEILWFDKSEKNARNNKAVNIAKLKNILSEIGDCELTKKTGYWKINLENNINKSDYLDFLNITSSRINLTKQNINKLIKITEKGAFLLNVHYDWLDEFKATVSDTIVDVLIEFGKSCDIKQDAEFIIHLADSVFNFDLVNEDAMVLKCRAEYCLGKHSLAKATYEKFFKEYLLMYNQEYEQSYPKILEIQN